MAKEANWTIVIDSFDGFAPSWFVDTYPFLGNKGHASAITDADLLDPGVLTQGPGMTALTAGTQAGAVTTLITRILPIPSSSDIGWAIGGAKLYKISSTAVTNDGTYPMTIDKGTVTGEDADDLSLYQSNLYIFYNHSGSAGDIAKLTIGTNTLDPDWGSTVPTGATALISSFHASIVGGDDVCYFTNGKYVGTIDGTTLNATALDFFTDSETVSLAWNENRVKIAVNRPNISGSNYSASGIYSWNGVSSSWEGDPIEVNGRIGALYTKNGIVYVWWQDAFATGGFMFGYVNGSILSPIARYSGTLPDQTQVGEYEGHIAFVSSNKVYLWGSREPNATVKLFQYASGTYATMGTFGAPFGTLMTSSNATTSYNLAKASGYATTTVYKTKAFDVSDADYISQIDRIQVWTRALASGAKVDFTMYYDEAKSNTTLDQIAYSASNYTRHKILDGGNQVEDFRLDISFANGSTSNPVKIKKIVINGHWVKRD